MARRSPKHKATALLLRRFPFGETSLIAHVLTDSGRRLSLVARGAYRPKSRLFGVLDLFDTLDLEWTEARGHSGGLAELRAADIHTRRRPITRDLLRYRAAHTGLELAHLASREEAPEPRLFQCLNNLFDHLCDPERQAGIERIAFDLELLDAAGLSPALEHCAACAEVAAPIEPGRAAFSAAAGGRLCPNCATRESAAGVRVGTLPTAVLAGAALIAGATSEARAQLPLPPPKLFRELRDFIDRFLEYHLETRLTTRLAQP